MRALKRLLIIVAPVLGAFVATPALAGEPYTRVMERPSGEVVLEMCTRTFEPRDADAPRVHLVSAIHIADRDYYQAMQAQLETYDTVLYEGVKPAGLDPIDPDLSDDAKAEATRDRLRLLVTLAEHYRAAHGRFPESLETMSRSDDRRIASIVSSVTHDGWGNRISVEREVRVSDDAVTRRIVFTSLGADGAIGGAGADADLVEEREVVERDGDKPVSTPQGIQTRLASALRVSFQLDEMDTTNPEWVNADMDINELQHALSEYGEDAPAILDMLEGESFSARLTGFILGFIERSPQLSSMMKLVLMDLLAFAETSDLMQEQEAMHRVIVEGRNEVVIEDLLATIEAHPGYADIAIFYGAGHMAGLEAALIEMGYEPAGDTWAEAMRVNPRDTGLNPGQVRLMRSMIKNSLQQQLGQ